MYNDSNQYNEWNDGDDNFGLPDVEFLDKFIESDVYKTICRDADVHADPDSIQFLDTVTIHLDSIMWHIEHGSPKSRVDWDLGKFRELVADFLE
jgi:hypothetical protein